jgi:hypothetical protein
VDVDEQRQHFEQALLRLSREVLGDVADYGLDPSPMHPSEARVRYVSKFGSGRSAGVRLDSAWLEACFFIESNVSILELDAFADDESYTDAKVRELLSVVRAFLGGKGSVESRRTMFGRRRPQLRISVNGREWVAR